MREEDTNGDRLYGSVIVPEVDEFQGINQPFKWLLEHKLGIIAAFLALAFIPFFLIFLFFYNVITGAPEFIEDACINIWAFMRNKNPHA